MTDAQQREAARHLFYKWNGKGKEDEDARSYWIDILQIILGVGNVTDRVEFEKKVIGGDGNTKRIDVFVSETHVRIEQKSLGIALDKSLAEHNGMMPYEQAKSDYDYSAMIVYNNFPWPEATHAQKSTIERTAQGYYDARSLYLDSFLADLYDSLTMPSELRKTHTVNDRAVMHAYGMPIKETDEASCMAWLMRLYQEKVGEQK